MSTSIPLAKLIEAMNDQPIAFNKHYVFIGCGINGALMLSQLVYWSSRTKDKDGWIYKTHEEWTLETGLTRREQDTARSTLKKLGFLTEKKQGVPCKLFFKVNHEKLYQALINYAQSLDSSQLHNSAKLDAQNSQTSCTDAPDCMHESAKLVAQIRPTNTENTYRDYTENTSESVKGNSQPKFSAKKTLLNLGVSERTANEYLELRARKKKPVTDRVIQLVVKQAEIANISLERAFTIVTVRGWDSFRADWQWQETNTELDQLEKPQNPSEQQNQPQGRFIAERVQYGQGLGAR